MPVQALGEEDQIQLRAPASVSCTFLGLFWSPKDHTQNQKESNNEYEPKETALLMMLRKPTTDHNYSIWLWLCQ